MTLWQRFVVGFWRDDSRNNQKSPFRQGTNCEHSLRDRQSGHSGLVSHHSTMHVQQKMCPHGVAVGVWRSERQSGHLCF